ncbi:hypothetical protein SAMN06265222_118107 [Neorhodopirellula lusitana]|uniref:Uncharacterized protein n=2 Tax=Neorhodopirellula lusitana TaxID=445327 RepID=A0ABY1QLS3_9BACT|nr:hypothetical protein SAMN06265222_118107 [Neorhodopirellula lusitana]
MKRFSLRQLVIVVPVLAAIVAAWYSAADRRERQQAIAHFSRCIEQDDALNLGWTTQALGKDFVIRRFTDAAKQNPNFVYDGGVRFAQILPDCHDNGRVPGDGYNLCGFGGSAGCMIWSGPAGTRISSLTFDRDTLKIQIYGDLELGSFKLSVPRSDPDVYVLHWPSDSPNPPMHTLNEMIATRHAGSMTRIPDRR